MNRSSDSLEGASENLDRAQSVIEHAQRAVTTAEKVRDTVERPRHVLRFLAIVAVGALAIGALVAASKQRR
jgi:hypothetical protein